MKSFIGGLAIAVPLMFGSALSWADPWKDESGHGRHGKHWSKHAEKEWKHEHKHWDKHRRKAERHYYRDARRNYYRSEVVVQHHHYPAPYVTEPRYYAPPAWAHAPAPGVHVVMPDVYIPF